MVNSKMQSTSNDDEILKDIPGFSSYQISNYGYIINRSTFKILKSIIDSYGFERVTVKGDDGKSHPIKIHRALAVAFIPNPNNYKDVIHIDGNKLNNSLDNLTWGIAKYFGRSSRKVKDVTTGICYVSISEAGRNLGVSFHDIIKSINTSKPIKNHTFEYIDL